MTLRRMTSQLQVFLLAANLVSYRMTSHNGLADKAVSKWWPLKSIFQLKTNFCRIGGTLEAKTSVSGKAECLLGIGKDKKSTKLSGATFLFNLKISKIHKVFAKKCVVVIYFFYVIPTMWFIFFKLQSWTKVLGQLSLYFWHFCAHTRCDFCSHLRYNVEN